MKTVALKLGICSALLLGAAGSDAFALSQTTAQGVMVAVDLTGDMVVQPSETWVYAPTAAQMWYSNIGDSEPLAVACHGNASSCAPGNAPSPIPAAPPPDPKALASMAMRDRCAFFDGGELSRSAYTQGVDMPGRNGQGNWHYTFSYQIAPRASHADPRTAWFSSQRPPVITLRGYVAAQSTVRQQAPAASWHLEAFHGLFGPDGQPRLQDMHMSVQRMWRSTDGFGVEFMQISSARLDYTVESGADFFFLPNAGMRGSADQIVAGPIHSIHLGEVPSQRGLADDFAGNDTDFGDRAVLAPVSFDLAGPGSYIVAVTGTMKDIDGGVDTPFATSDVVQVMADTCAP